MVPRPIYDKTGFLVTLKQKSKRLSVQVWAVSGIDSKGHWLNIHTITKKKKKRTFLDQLIKSSNFLLVCLYSLFSIDSRRCIRPFHGCLTVLDTSETDKDGYVYDSVRVVSNSQHRQVDGKFFILRQELSNKEPQSLTFYTSHILVSGPRVVKSRKVETVLLTLFDFKNTGPSDSH